MGAGGGRSGTDAFSRNAASININRATTVQDFIYICSLTELIPEQKLSQSCRLEATLSQEDPDPKYKGSDLQDLLHSHLTLTLSLTLQLLNLCPSPSGLLKIMNVGVLFRVAGMQLAQHHREFGGPVLLESCSLSFMNH